jgi:hypothetical protein
LFEKTAWLKIAEYPGPRVIAKSAQALSKGRHSILIEFDNNEVRVQVDNIQAVDSNHLSPACSGVLLAAYC